MEQNDSEEAIQLLDDYLPIATDQEKVHIIELYLEYGFIQQAKVITESLLTENPQNSEYKSILANIYIELEEDNDALQLLHDIKSDDPKYLQSLIQLADLYEAQGLYEVAEQKLYEAKNQEPNELIIDLALGELLFSIGKFNECIVFYERILKEAEQLGHVPITLRLAEAYAAIGKYESAFKLYQQTEDKDDPDTLFKYGLTAHHVKRVDVAIAIWEQLLELDPHYYVAYYYLGTAYQEEGMIEEALHLTKEGLQYDEHNHKLFYLAAVLAHQNGEHVESEAFIRKAIELDPEYRDANLFLIKLLYESSRFEEIVEFVKDILANNVYDPFYEWEIARAYYELDLIEKASPHFEEASKNMSHNTEFLREYGMFLAELGHSKDAMNILNEYLKHEPMDDYVTEYVSRLSELYE